MLLSTGIMSAIGMMLWAFRLLPGFHYSSNNILRTAFSPVGLAPRGHWVMSQDIFDGHDLLGRFAGFSKQRPGC